MKENPEFTKWSDQWKQARVYGSSLDSVLQLWRMPTPKRFHRNTPLPFNKGYRKNNEDDVEEQRIERALLEPEGLSFALTLRKGSQTKQWHLTPSHQNVALANQKKGQVIADVFGCVTGASKHPVMIEVKTKANNPWHALIENLQQVRLARACAHRSASDGQVDTHPLNGCWGLVLAPRDYSSKRRGQMEKCRTLLERLKKETQARIAFGIWDANEPTKIELLDCSNW